MSGSRVVYVNGEYLDENDARISVFDRGFMFADGVYEVSTVLNGRLIDNAAHLVRLCRSLGELGISEPMRMDEFETVQKEVVHRNALREGTLYCQVTRGAADRDFAYPRDTLPSVVMFTQAKSVLENPLAETGIRVISTPDLRWRRRDIKSTALTFACMAKQKAVEAGVHDAWLIEDGFVTEGSSNNTYIITAEDTLVTRQLSDDILHGITRQSVLALAEKEQLIIDQRPFTIDEAYAAKEAFITSASIFVLPVVEIDGHPIGDGSVGEISKKLRQRYIDMALSGA